MSRPFGQVGPQPSPHSLEVLVLSCYPQNLGQLMFPGIFSNLIRLQGMFL